MRCRDTNFEPEGNFEPDGSPEPEGPTSRETLREAARRGPDAPALVRTVVLGAGLLLSAAAASSATFVVDSTLDTRDISPGDGICLASIGGIEFRCTLRAAIEEANALPGADEIELPASTFELTRTGSESSTTPADDVNDLDITDDLLLQAPSGAVITTSQDHRLVEVVDSTVEIVGVVLEGPGAPTGAAGGCLLARDSTLTLREVTVQDCHASSGGGLYFVGGDSKVLDSWIVGNVADAGGGIVCTGICSIVRSAVTGNHSAGNGGGILATGSAVAKVVTATVSGNTAANWGGGISVTPTAVLELLASTVVRNTAAATCCLGDGGGIHLSAAADPSSPQLVVRGSIIAWNRDLWSSLEPGTGRGLPGEHDCDSSIDNRILSEGHNTLGTNCAGFLSALTDQFDQPSLGPLAFVGSPTPVHPPNNGSSVVDAGSGVSCLVSGFPDFDQRGEARPVDGGASGPYCDTGSVEVQADEAWIFGDGFESGDDTLWS